MSVNSSGLSRGERGGGAGDGGRSGATPQFDCVRTIRTTAAIIGIAEVTLRVMIREGRGPQVTRLSARRIGIRDSHRQFWLDSRAVAR
jgi:hypothetical protein